MRTLAAFTLILAIGTAQACAPQRSSEAKTGEQAQAKQGSTSVSDDWAKRATALAVGTTYCVQRPIGGLPDRPAFEVGEKVRLTQVAYSRYDNMHVYTFETNGSGLKSFWLGDEQALETLNDAFKRC